MELPALDKHCSYEHCMQLDFLPLSCECQKLFCSKHFVLHIEHCPRHLSVTYEDNKRIQEVYKCSEVGCESTSLVALFCDKCGKHFCVNHRHIIRCLPPDPEAIAAEKEKYAAPVRQFNDAKAAVDKQVDSKILAAKKNTRKSAMANKVQLLRIKNKATGLKTVPPIDRVYFNIQHPKGDKCFPVYFSRTWTLGRMIDAAAVELNLQNDNNKAQALKLRLFNNESFNVVSKDLSQSLESLIESGIITEGSTLIIQYVNDDCVTLNV